MTAFKMIRAALLSAAATLCAATAQAAPVLYSDYASWAAALGGPVASENFSGLGSNINITNGAASLGDVTLMSSFSSSGTAVLDAGANAIDIDAMRPADAVTVSFAGPVAGFGFFYSGFDATNDPLTVRVEGTTIASLPNGLFDFTNAFFGVIDDTGGTYSAFDFGTTGSGMYARVGALHWADAPAPVPLPAGLPLLLAGLLGLAVLRRRA